MESKWIFQDYESNYKSKWKWKIQQKDRLKVTFLSFSFDQRKRAEFRRRWVVFRCVFLHEICFAWYLNKLHSSLKEHAVDCFRSNKLKHFLFYWLYLLLCTTAEYMHLYCIRFWEQFSNITIPFMTISLQMIDVYYPPVNGVQPGPHALVDHSHRNDSGFGMHWEPNNHKRHQNMLITN